MSKRVIAFVLMALWSFSASADSISDKNIDAFLYQYAEDYFYHSLTLAERFSKYKQEGNKPGFSAFKRKDWEPGYQKDKDFYDNSLEQNRKYFFDNDLTGYISNFDNIGIYAINLVMALNINDGKKEKEVFELIKRDSLELQQLFKERNLDINIPAGNYKKRGRSD